MKQFHNSPLPTWLPILLGITITFGIIFRLINLDHRLYWYDEAFTSLRISGYTQTELIQNMFTGQIIQARDLRKYQSPNPEKNLMDTVKGLAIEEPQHPPLYYIIARIWTRHLGSSVATIRSLSALMSLFVFPSIYWLCQELFLGKLTGLTAMALIAISPFHLYYAQEARQYSLWTVIIVLSSAALLRALRLKTEYSWGLYAVTLALALNTFLFSGFVAISQGIYVLILEKFRWTQTLKAYLASTCFSGMAFLPWLIVLTLNFKAVQDTTAWTSTPEQNLFYLVNQWVTNLRHLFYSFDPGIFRPFLILMVLTVVGSSLYHLCQKSPRKSGLFIFISTGVPALILLLHNFLMGGVISTVPRYQIPCYLGINLAISYFLSTQIHHKLGQALLIATITLGILSNFMNLNLEVFKYHILGRENPQIAQIINRQVQPLLISDDFFSNPGDILALTHQLLPSVGLLLFVEPQPIKIPDEFKSIFLFRSLDSQAKKPHLALEKTYKIEPVQPLKMLWRVTKKDAAKI